MKKLSWESLYALYPYTNFPGTSSIIKTLTSEDMELANKLYMLNGIKPDQIDTLSQKNIFPYLWFDSHEKMNATSLPGREHFNQHVDQQKNDEDYDYATKAWIKLECRTFEDYHDKYLLADVVLLATCFHAFRRNIY